jgi:hypothetical protein
MTKQKESKTCRTCGIRCEDCPLVPANNGKDVTCIELEMLYPEKAIAIVQKWSDENPQKTLLSELLRNYPNVPLEDDGTPEDVCPYCLGLMDEADCRRDHDCFRCWSQPVEGGSAEND